MMSWKQNSASCSAKKKSEKVLVLQNINILVVLFIIIDWPKIANLGMEKIGASSVTESTKLKYLSKFLVCIFTPQAIPN